MKRLNFLLRSKKQMYYRIRNNAAIEKGIIRNEKNK